MGILSTGPIPKAFRYRFTQHRSDRRLLSRLAITLVLALAVEINVWADEIAISVPSRAEVRMFGNNYQLFVNGNPFFIKGAGVGRYRLDELAACGANSFRTWHTSSGIRSMLDHAARKGLYVTLGLDVARERHGFNYDDKAAVARQLERVKKEVLKYKDHPAVIIWAIGNELNLDATNMNVWDAVNDISKMIHAVDTNHLTTSPVAGVDARVLGEIKTRASDLDVLSIQVYADIVNVPERLREAGWDGPYIITEWGATGHWESPQTGWGAPVENDSTTKAQLYKSRYETIIAADRKQCLGSYAFLWGQKQERTPTWYGVFLESGEATESVDVLQFLWSGNWPANRCPQIQGAWLDGKTSGENIRLNPGKTYGAKITGSDPDGDPLDCSWEVMEESSAKTTGGDRESKPLVLPGLIQNPYASEIVLQAPARPGAYRLFTYLRDGNGHAAHVNIPFYVNPDHSVQARSEQAFKPQQPISE